MTTDRDPTLQSLFEVAKQDFAGDAFTDQVMLRIDTLRRRTVIVWVCVGLVAVAFTWSLAAPILHTVNLATQILPETLIELDDRTLAQILAPVNSIAGAVGLGFLGLRLAYKKVFSHR